MTRLRSLAPLFLSALLGSALQAQPFLVEDIRVAQTAGDLFPFSPAFAELGGIVYFTGQDSVHGTELWRSDGTEAGTWPVADICAGICSSGITRLGTAGGAVFFGANDGFHGEALWKSDGTAAGTVPVREVPVFETIGEVGGVLLFVGSSPEGDKELWRSDGTGAGTFPLGSEPLPIGYAGSWLLFAASDPVHGVGLWRTDGTAAGTSFVEDFEFLGGWPYDRKLYPSIGSRLFFPGSNNRLWVSDGTPEGTEQVSDVPMEANGNTWITLAVIGSEVFFSGHDDDHGTELWKSDGTAAGTVRVKDIKPGTEDSFPSELTAAGGQIFFKVQTLPATFSFHLWKSDGTEAGTVPVEPSLALAEDFNALLALGDDLVLFAFDDSHGHEPWRSDGTEAGTQLLADVYPGGSSFGGFSLPLSRLDAGVIASGHWFFRALTPDGWALWKSDGTPAGTQLVKSGGPVPGSGLAPVTEMADLDGALLFPANDGNTGPELWRSDGTAPGTSLVIDLTPGSQWSPLDHLTAFGGYIYFSANGGLRRTDGTEAGTEFVDGSFGGELVVAGPGLYFVCNSVFTAGVCRADGPFVQTLWNPFGSAASQLTAAGSTLFFNGSTEDQELWKTNGVPGDAVKLEIVPGTGSSDPQSIAAFGSSVLFSADDGTTGRELWISNGTPAGTRRVKDILPGAASSNPRSIVVAGSVAFFIADDVLTGTELWRSDGTTAGTFRIRDIRPGSQSSSIQGLTAFADSVVLFTADNGVTGQELWASFGSADAAFMVKDIRPGAASSFPSNFRRVGHTILFAADDGTHGLEPWQTDGFAGGTFLVHDVFPGPEPSSPSGFTLSGDYLFFTANDGTHGFELWAMDRTELGSSLDATKRVMSPTYPGAAVTYEIVITNTGAGPHPDNPGNEMVDMLPTGFTLTGASSDVGTVTVDLPNNLVAWNGALDLGESATVLIHATLSPSAIEYGMIFNQATVNYDANGDGINEKTGVSNDPGRPEPDDPTLSTVSTPPLDFHTVTPCRVLDTRTSSPLASGELETFAIAGTCGIPPTARAVAANLTVVGATGSGHVVLHPAGIPHSVPITSSANFTAVRARANNAMLPLAGGAVDATATVTGGGTVHLILDVNGYYE
jgi:ELWxxDGT repeat protein